MFGLFMFGPILEFTMGSKKFFNFYFICGIGGVLLQLIVQAMEVHAITGGFTISHPELESSYLAFGDNAQKLFDIYNGQLVGASGAIFGILVAFGVLYPNMELLMFFIPVPIKAKYIVSAYIIYEIYATIAQKSGDNVAHLAHLGGGLFAFLLIKLWGIRGNNYY